MIDEANIILVFDIQSLILIQTIPAGNNNSQAQIQGLVCLTNNIFWIYGRRFFQFDTFQLEDDENQASKDNDYPLCVYLNHYSLSLFSVKKNEIRMYSLKSGQLESLHSSIFPDTSNKAEITYFRIDRRHRKAYVTNSMGQIFVINCQNGVIMKNIT